MKKFIFSLLFCLAMCGFVFAQTALPELDKIKQIKVLESTREDVKRIFREYDEESEGDSYSTDKMTIRISYSSGNCSGKNSENWNIAEGRATEIFVEIYDSTSLRNLNINLSKLERIKSDDEDEDDDDVEYLYYDQEKGISYTVSEGKVSYIKFIPPKKDYPALCNNESVRQFKSNDDWFRSKIREPWVCYLIRPIANVNELNLDKNEFTPDCPANDSIKAEINSDYAKIEVATKGGSSDPTDVLTYNYTVSAGKIVGSGANVTWDLSGVKPGSYTITAGVDNGCGICGETKTQEVVVKEPFCPQKEK